MGAAQLFSGMWETTIFYNGTEVKVSSNLVPKQVSLSYVKQVSLSYVYRSKNIGTVPAAVCVHVHSPSAPQPYPFACAGHFTSRRRGTQ